MPPALPHRESSVPGAGSSRIIGIKKQDTMGRSFHENIHLRNRLRRVFAVGKLCRMYGNTGTAIWRTVHGRAMLPGKRAGKL